MPSFPAQIALPSPCLPGYTPFRGLGPRCLVPVPTRWDGRLRLRTGDYLSSWVLHRCYESERRNTAASGISPDPQSKRAGLPYGSRIRLCLGVPTDYTLPPGTGGPSSEGTYCHVTTANEC